jgi:prophage antirepressor-like protein
VEETNKCSVDNFEVCQIGKPSVIGNALNIQNNNYKNTVLINETGLYELIISASTEKSKLFKNWVTGTVLPTLRKHGSYTIGQENLPSNIEQQFIEMQKKMVDMFQNFNAQEEINKLQKSLIETQEALLVSEYGKCKVLNLLTLSVQSITMELNV